MSFEVLVFRIRARYRSVPGLQLTVEQASRLWQLDPLTCEAALRHLARERFLSQRADGVFIEASDGAVLSK